MKSPTIKSLYDALNEDEARQQKPFEAAFQTASQVMIHPFATFDQKEEALSSWLQKKGNQPCLFGRIAAALNRMHYCILTEYDLRESDETIAAKIRREQQLWKQQSLMPGNIPKHGFMLVASSPRLLLAAPDAQLKAFSLRLRELWGLTVEKDEEANDLCYETLYLKHPEEDLFLKYTFTADYFAAAGDGRWWTDHRIPGGIAFSANSLGHLVQYRTWYEGKSSESQIEWALQTAMLTINEANEEPSTGPATYLLPLEKEKPHQPSTCPFSGAGKASLAGKDWSTYAGLLHTDHSIRDEFFSGKLPERAKRPYQMDFTYIFSKGKADYVKFMAGQQISMDEVYAELGHPETWRVMVKHKPTLEAISKTDEELEGLLTACRSWRLDEAELVELSN